MSLSRNVLAVGVSREEFSRISPFLDRDVFEVDRFPSGTGALDLVAKVPFELLLVRHPLGDLEVSSFLDAVRRHGSPCQRSAVLLLTPDDDDDGASSFIGRGANRTISLQASEERIQESISSVLNVAPRKSHRFMARLEIAIGGATDMITCQTENLSATGMLVRTDRLYDVGTEIDFEFSLPGDPRKVRGVAEVVRQTSTGRDSIHGLGMRFLSFAGDSQRRFSNFVKRLD